MLVAERRVEEKKEGRRREGSGGKRTRESECRPVAQRLARQPRVGQTEDKNIQEEAVVRTTKYGVQRIE